MTLQTCLRGTLGLSGLSFHGQVQLDKAHHTEAELTRASWGWDQNSKSQAVIASNLHLLSV